jgi:aspartate oxidase
MNTLQKLNKNLITIEQEFNKGINKDIIELKNLCLTAILMTQAALKRKKSIGCHFIKKT